MIRRFFLWLLIVIWGLSISACTPTLAQPTATTAPTLAPTITPDATQPLVLVLPSFGEQKSLIAANRHYSDAVKRMGWNVEFYTVQSYDAYGTDIYLPYMNKQLCSGAARADGFFCMESLPSNAVDPLTQAKANGQLYDCVAAAPQAIPKYWAKYQAQITAGKYGLVLVNQMMSAPIADLAVAVRKDVLPLAPKGISCYDDLRALIAQLEHVLHEKACVQAYPQQLLNLWTKQQGYLELFPDAGIYASIDDPDAKPVMLEDITGFRQFLEDILALRGRRLFRDPSYSSSSIGSDSQPPVGASAVGPAVAVDSPYFFLYNYNVQHMSWEGYTAIAWYGDTSSYASNILEAENTNMRSRQVAMRELIIPARSRRATDAMAFIQWLYEDRRNADAAIYGQEGEDYTLQGERVVLPVGASPQDTQKLTSWLNWEGRYLFQYSAERRILADAPEQAESLLAAKPLRPLAAPWLVYLYHGKAWENLMSKESDSRQNAMGSFMSMIDTPFDAELFIDRLRAGATDSILQPYRDVLAAARAAAQP